MYDASKQLYNPSKQPELNRDAVFKAVWQRDTDRINELIEAEKARMLRSDKPAVVIFVKKIEDRKGIPRPEGYMKNPYIGKDGKDYHSPEVLAQANAEYLRRMHPKKIRQIFH